MPSVRSPTDVLIQVHATSLNPLDVAMRGEWLGRGYTHAEHEEDTSEARGGHAAPPCFSCQVAMEPDC